MTDKKKGMQERHVVDWLEVVGHPKADRETKTVSILYEIETYTKLIHHFPFQRLLAASQGLCWIIHIASCVCASDFLISVSASLSPIFRPGNTNSVFALDYISGSLTVNGQLDRENPLYSAGFTLTVKVSWMGSRWEMERLSQPRGEIESLFHQWIKRKLWYYDVLSQCSVWVWCSIIGEVNTTARISKDFKVNSHLTLTKHKILQCHMCLQMLYQYAYAQMWPWQFQVPLCSFSKGLWFYDNVVSWEACSVYCHRGQKERRRTR